MRLNLKLLIVKRSHQMQSLVNNSEFAFAQQWYLLSNGICSAMVFAQQNIPAIPSLGE